MWDNRDMDQRTHWPPMQYTHINYRLRLPNNTRTREEKVVLIGRQINNDLTDSSERHWRKLGNFYSVNIAHESTQ